MIQGGLGNFTLKALDNIIMKQICKKYLAFKHYNNITHAFPLLGVASFSFENAVPNKFIL